MNKKILFNKPEDGNYWLTNFETGYPIRTRLPSKLTSEGKIAADSVFLTDELEWATSEHLFQALKYSWSDRSQLHLVTHIQNLKSPDEAQKFTWKEENKKCPPIRNDWHKDEYKLNAMHWVIREKFTQHSELKEKLIGTKDADLVEETKGRNDKYWGVSFGVGDNYLGKILMKIREEIVDESRTGSASSKTCAFCSKTLDPSTTGVIFDNKSYCSNECSTKQQEKGNSSSGSNNKPENEENQGTNESNEQPTQPEPSPQSNPEPTQQEVNSARSKLDKVQEDRVDEEEIIRIIKETSETVKNSGDENLKKQKEEAEKKLSKDKLRQIIREEIKTLLSEEGVKTEELTSSVKQKLDKLNNNNNNNNNDQAIRTEVLNEIGNQSLNKLINEVEKALKLGKKVLASKIAELKKFINSKVDYKQQAYKLQKVKVEKLLSQAQSKLVHKDNEGFLCLNNPTMWISGVVIISLAVGVGLLVVRVRRKRKQG